MRSNIDRRTFLSNALKGAGALALSPAIFQLTAHAQGNVPPLLSKLGPLRAPDENGIRLPGGLRSRVIAESGRLVRTDSSSWFNYTSYVWHIFPDGGATFATPDGGFIYVSNSEVPVIGGAGALRFDARGRRVDAYSILSGTSSNCAGGPTPWGRWLSCEEIPFGSVFECDPTGGQSAQRRPALGLFKHEAVAVDPVHGQLYLTEDETDGRLYRFTPSYLSDAGHPLLDDGTLEVALVGPGGAVSFRPLPNPRPNLLQTATRYQVAASTPFNGGEGIWWHEGIVYFTTKGDNRVWTLDTSAQRLSVLYDAATSPTPILTGVDNVTVAPSGHVLIAEDGGDMQIVVLDAAGRVTPLLQVTNQGHSEITGPAFSPDGTRLFFSSQRGANRRGQIGLTYEISLS